MKITLEILGDQQREGILNLKKYLENANIDDMEDIQIYQTAPQKGEMSSGTLTNKISATLEATDLSATELATTLLKYANIFNTDISLKDDNNNEVLINNNLTKNEITLLFSKFTSS